jgi:hypothetical protein
LKKTTIKTTARPSKKKDTRRRRHRKSRSTTETKKNIKKTTKKRSRTTSKTTTTTTTTARKRTSKSNPTTTRRTTTTRKKLTTKTTTTTTKRTTTTTTTTTTRKRIITTTTTARHTTSVSAGSNQIKASQKNRKLLQKGADLTYYWIAHPDDYDHSGKSVTVKTCDGKSLGTVSQEYADALVMEGTGIVDGNIINLGSCSCNNYACFMEVDKKEDPYGLTGTIFITLYLLVCANKILHV